MRLGLRGIVDASLVGYQGTGVQSFIELRVSPLSSSGNRELGGERGIPAACLGDLIRDAERFTGRWYGVLSHCAGFKVAE